MFEDPPILHFGVDSPVPPRSEGEVALAFDDDLAVVEESRQSALREEDNGVLIVAKVVVVLEVGDYLFVVHFAGHEVPFDQAARIVYPRSVLYQIAQPF